MALSPYSSSAAPGAPAAPASAAPGLARLNAASADAAEAALLGCCASRRWARQVAARRPYPTVAALLAAGDAASRGLT
ncbi:2-oxo-4-hydroxy-4-carboxy-5-ureidoimidazoline decarboxylase, partial [Streptomyces sp. B1866]|uniref:2-oxo-4-hydroxy-4-carboxy-5-ureidoimidazoline decarboxylase n=1 Tax=Streptomyces sp. B1866 TaxID=3075431 RepID=UPI0028921EB7|nr:2-oxo-4-hydroxy-4-carboxy-5-ureidoimidazoline decarboxylase [Streptomyces sp. B1866]